MQFSAALVVLVIYGFAAFLISFVHVWFCPFCMSSLSVYLFPLTALIAPICPVYQPRPVLPSSSQPAALASQAANLLSSLAFPLG